MYNKCMNQTWLLPTVHIYVLYVHIVQCISKVMKKMHNTSHTCFTLHSSEVIRTKTGRTETGGSIQAVNITYWGIECRHKNLLSCTWLATISCTYIEHLCSCIHCKDRDIYSYCYHKCHCYNRSYLGMCHKLPTLKRNKKTTSAWFTSKVISGLSDCTNNVR